MPRLEEETDPVRRLRDALDIVSRRTFGIAADAGACGAGPSFISEPRTRPCGVDSETPSWGQQTMTTLAKFPIHPLVADMTKRAKNAWKGTDEAPPKVSGTRADAAPCRNTDDAAARMAAAAREAWRGEPVPSVPSAPRQWGTWRDAAGLWHTGPRPAPAAASSPRPSAPSPRPLAGVVRGDDAVRDVARVDVASVPIDALGNCRG